MKTVYYVCVGDSGVTRDNVITGDEFDDVDYKIVSKGRTTDLTAFLYFWQCKKLMGFDLAPFSRSGAYSKAKRLNKQLKAQNAAAVATVVSINVDPCIGYQVTDATDPACPKYSYANRPGPYTDKDVETLCKEGKDVKYLHSYSRSGANKHLKKIQTSESKLKIESYEVF